MDKMLTGQPKVRDPNFVQYARSEHQGMYRKSLKSRSKFSANPRYAVFSKSSNPLNLSQNSAIRAIFKDRSVDPRIYLPPHRVDLVVKRNASIALHRRV